MIAVAAGRSAVAVLPRRSSAIKEVFPAERRWHRCWRVDQRQLCRRAKLLARVSVAYSLPEAAMSHWCNRRVGVPSLLVMTQQSWAQLPGVEGPLGHPAVCTVIRRLKLGCVSYVLRHVFLSPDTGHLRRLDVGLVSQGPARLLSLLLSRVLNVYL
jgi:hypothetical protein